MVGPQERKGVHLHKEFVYLRIKDFREALVCIDCVEGLYCKRPIQCMASSEILTPHPLTARRVCGGAHSVGGEVVGGSIVRKTPDTALYSIYKNFVIGSHDRCTKLARVHAQPMSTLSVPDSVTPTKQTVN
jgi:hypothetical protein